MVVCDCGTASPASARFCASCGRALGSTTATVDESRVVDVLRSFVSPQVADRITASSGRPVEERRLVTALFADLSGFTTLAGRLDAEDLLAVVDPLIAGLTGIVARHDGYVEKFAGDALLAFFGAPVAHEDDADRAVRCALEMQARLPDLTDHPEGAGLTLHVGVNTGSVVARTVGAGARLDYAVLGEPVILAQRLESLAPAGSTYVGELTMRLTADRYAYEPLGALAVKGRAEPVPAYRLDGPRERVRTRPRLIGRHAERAVLSAALDDLAEGLGSVVAVAGPAGSGKSRLLDHLADAAAAAGVATLRLGGASYAEAPYESFRPLVTGRTDDPDDPYAAVVLGRPVAQTALAGRDPEALRRDLHAAALGWLTERAEAGPLVVLVDDAQWIDPSSADLVDGLGRQLTGELGAPPVLLVRADRPDPARPALPGAVEVALGGLPTADVATLVVDELSAVPDDHLVAEVAQRTGGNPLMVRALVRHLAAEGALDTRMGHVRLVAGAATETVPVTLEGLLAARVDALDHAVVQAATAAAVVGFAVPPDLLAAVAEPAAPAELLVAAGLLVPGPGGLRFESAMLRGILYSRLTARRRRELHARVVAAVEPVLGDGEAGSALLAEHLFLAGDPAGALPRLRVSAARARAVSAHDEAVRALTRAVECARSTDPGLLATVLCDLADVRADRGEYDRAGGLFREAVEHGGGSRAWAGRAAALRRTGDYAGALAVLEEADAARPPGDLRLLAEERSWTCSVSGDFDASRAAAGAGLRLDRDGPGDRVTARLLLQTARVEIVLGLHDAARTHLATALALLADTDDRGGRCTGLRLLGQLHEAAGDLDAAAVTLDLGLAEAERFGVVEEIGGCLVNLGLVHSARGDHEAASAAYARAAAVFEQVDHRPGRAVAYGNRSYELFALGRPTEARELALAAVALADEVGNTLVSADVRQTLALVEESLGDDRAAVEQADAAVAGFTALGMPEAAADSRAVLARLRSSNGS